jgi:hypothetical protein
MTAATQDIKTDKVGLEDTPPPPLLALPIETNVQVFAGCFAANNAAGRIVPCTSASALFLWGRIERGINNLNSNTPYGAAGAQNVAIRPGPYYFSSDGSIAATNLGQAVFALDDNTITSNPTKTGVTYWLPFAGVVIPPAIGDFGFSPTDATKVPVWVGYPWVTGIVLHANIAISLATIQAATSGTAFNIAPVMPSNARLIDAQINVGTAVSGGTISAATLSLSGGADAVTSIIGATNVFTAAPTPGAAVGTNPYPGRGGQQLKATLTTTGDTPNHATAGVLSVDVFYTIAP